MTAAVLYVNSSQEHSGNEENAKKDSSGLQPVLLSRPGSPGIGALGDTICLVSSPGSNMHMESQEVVLGQLGSLTSQLFMMKLKLMAWEEMLGCPCLSTW